MAVMCSNADDDDNVVVPITPIPNPFLQDYPHLLCPLSENNIGHLKVSLARVLVSNATNDGDYVIITVTNSLQLHLTPFLMQY